MALIVRIFWFALIYYATLKFSSACSCQHPTLSEAVKNSDWVSRLTVVGVKPEPAKRGRRSNFLVITVKHQNPIKVPESMKTKGLPEKIRTSIYSSMCGLKVDKDKTYTLAGQVYNGALQADLCGLVKSVS